MGRAAVLGALAAAGCVLAPGLSIQPAEAGVSARGFACGSASGAPATNVVTGDGRQVPVIRWTSSVFSDAGWSQQRRCQEVSERFDGFLKQGRLSYITTGRMNGQPVICTARNKGGACDGLLFTLKPGQDATSTLKNLLEILDELLSTAQANAGSGVAPAHSPAPAQGGTTLW